MEGLERTLVVIKPDGVQRGLIGPILTRFEQKGFRVLALRLLMVSPSMAETHYAVHHGKFFYQDLVGYISSGPVVAIVLEGVEAIKAVRLLVGSTRPHEAAPGTIRGDLALTGLRNLIHASDAPETATAEISLWFPGDDIASYERGLDRWIFE